MQVQNILLRVVSKIDSYDVVFSPGIDNTLLNVQNPTPLKVPVTRYVMEENGRRYRMTVTAIEAILIDELSSTGEYIEAEVGINLSFWKRLFGDYKVLEDESDSSAKLYVKSFRKPTLTR